MKTAKKQWSLFKPPPDRRNPRRPSHEPGTLEIIFEKLPLPGRRMAQTVRSKGHAFTDAKRERENLANNKSMIRK